MTLTKCGCCREGIPSQSMAFIDADFGQICEDCYDGIQDGKEIFSNPEVMGEKTVSGVFRGICPDNMGGPL